MSTMVSSEIKNIVDMNQFEKSDGESIEDIGLNISLDNDIGIISRATSVKFKSNRVYLNFFCNTHHVNSLLNTSQIKEIKVGTALIIQSAVILSKQFTNIDNGMYQVELVVLNCNN